MRYRSIRRVLVAICAAAAFAWFAGPAAAEAVKADVVVYGGTAGGVTAAVAAARAGRTVVLIEPHVRVGGMVSGGLCKTDMGRRDTVGGLADEFFRRVVDYYRTKYGPDSPQVRQCRNGADMEPSIAEHLFNEMLREQPRVTVLTRHRLVGATVDRGRVTTITVEDIGTGARRECRGAVFVDAGYEGDLIAAAGVPYRVGREARSEYGESAAGIKRGPAALRGHGDHLVQSYNIRGTITNRPDLAVPFPKPKYYDPAPFLHWKQRAVRGLATTFEELFADQIRTPLPNGKFDPNVADIAGVVQGWPEGTAAGRAAIYGRIRDHWLSLFWMAQNDPDLPVAFRASARKWGLPKDEYPENGNVTPQVYVRVARRMVGSYLLTQNDVRANRFKKDGVCIGSYGMDSHHTQILTTPTGRVEEGNFIELTDPYEIPYGCLTPRNVSNLLAVCAISATHVGYASVRMEPVFMMLGHAAGLAASQAVERDVPVQAVDTAALRTTLKAQGAVLAAPYRPVIEIVVDPPQPKPGEPVTLHARSVDVRKPLKKFWWNLDGTGKLQGTTERVTFTFPVAKVYEVTVFAEDAAGMQTEFTTAAVPVGGPALDVTLTAEFDDVLVGDWKRARAKDYDRRLLYTDDRGVKGEQRAVFSATLPRDGRYAVCVAYPPGKNRPANVPLTIRHAGGTATLALNQKKADTPFVFKAVGEYRFRAADPAVVELRTEGTDGVVAADAVRWVWLGE